jgi:hypothetical protein
VYVRLEELEGQYSTALDEVARLEQGLRDATTRQQQLQQHGGRSQGHSHGAGTGSLLQRTISAYVMDLIPQRLRRPSREQLQVEALNRTVERLRENATALLEVIESRNCLVDELNERVEAYEEDSVRRRKTVASLREAISELTEDVNQKSDELQALREELRGLLQEKMWRDANLTRLESKAVLGEVRRILVT